MKNWKIIGIIATAFLVLAIPLYLVKGYFTDNQTIHKDAQFVGGKQCIECHEPQYKLWKDSNHDKAMDSATPLSVRGDFNNAEFERNGFVHRFYQKDGKYFVHTLGKNGEPVDLQITYTFGTKPLQQYLIPFEDGRLQCLPIAWDTITNRWYHLYDSVYKGQDIKPDDWLYWTNNGQNWNGMCAECHSTNLNKRFDPKTKVFKTTWSDIDVNCEACHGPGSEHLEWAKLPEMARPTDVNTGLIVQTSNITSRKYVYQCAYCHARRSGLGYYPNNGAALLDHIVPGLPTPPNYYIDGQILEEDYEYGSFTQSKMYMKGVKCNDCHNVHSLKLVKKGNELCLQCHVRENYDNYNHTFHKKVGEDGKVLVVQNGKKKIEVGEGSLCINCHMTGKYYMGIHFRHDHSFRIPRPDLTIELGTPNACNNCHLDKTPKWSMEYISKWYGEKKKSHYGTVLETAQNGDASAFPQLQNLVESELTPPIVRASLLDMANTFPAELTSEIYNHALGDTIPLVRLVALNNYSNTDIKILVNKISMMLTDPMLAIRTQAANNLSAIPLQYHDTNYRKVYEQALAEYIETQEYVADFAAGRHNLGNLYSNLGKYDEAIENYLAAIDIDNKFYPSKINLATVYSQTGKGEEAEKLLQNVIVENPELDNVYYSYGLLLAENKKYDLSLFYLLEAAKRMPRYARVWYNLGNMYQFFGENNLAEEAFQKTIELEPENLDYQYNLLRYFVSVGEMKSAKKCALEIYQKFPDNPDRENLLQFINSPSN